MSRKQAVKGGIRHGVNYGASTGLGILIAKIAPELSLEEAVVVANLIAFVVHRIYALGKRLLERWLGPGAVLLVMLGIPADAAATDWRVPIECHEVETSTAPTEEMGICMHGDRVWFDVAIGVDLAALKLTGEPGTVRPAAALTIGAGIYYAPLDWPTSKLVGGELTIGGNLFSIADQNDVSHRELWLVAGVNVLGFVQLGPGVLLEIAARPGERTRAVVILATGARLPL